MSKLHILFLCTGNSCRSQMAEGFTRHYKGNDIVAYSAGTHPKGLDTLAVLAMNEIGIDISSQSSKHVATLGHIPFDYIITVCDQAYESCPVIPGAKMFHIGFGDPPTLTAKCQTVDEKLIYYRKVRDEISNFVQNLPTILIS